MSLPTDWVAHQAENGVTFYYNSATGVTQWHSPALPQFEEAPKITYNATATNAASSVSSVRPGPSLLCDDNLEPEEKKKDYIYMAKEYKVMEKYRDLKGSQKCVMCNKNVADVVFFPCAHKAICGSCTSGNGIGASGSGGWNMCPVCCGDIKWSTAYKDGVTEPLLYMNWVEEQKPLLPTGFKQNFEEATIALKMRTQKNYKTSFDEAAAGCCCMA